MSRVWKTITSLVALASLAALIVSPVGDQRQLSVEAWLTTVAALIALSIILNLFTTAPVKAAELATIWRQDRTEQEAPIRMPRNLSALEGMLLSARDNRRAFALRLHPRLVDVADHYLRTDHGTDPTLQPERTAQILGETGWLIDKADDSDRTPELAEVEHLLDRLLERRTTFGLSGQDSLNPSPDGKEQS